MQHLCELPLKLLAELRLALLVQLRSGLDDLLPHVGEERHDRVEVLRLGFGSA